MRISIGILACRTMIPTGNIVLFIANHGLVLIRTITVRTIGSVALVKVTTIDPIQAMIIDPTRVIVIALIVTHAHLHKQVAIVIPRVQTTVTGNADLGATVLIDHIPQNFPNGEQGEYCPRKGILTTILQGKRFWTIQYQTICLMMIVSPV